MQSSYEGLKYEFSTALIATADISVLCGNAGKRCGRLLQTGRPFNDTATEDWAGGPELVLFQLWVLRSQRCHAIAAPYEENIPCAIE